MPLGKTLLKVGKVALKIAIALAMKDKIRGWLGGNLKKVDPKILD